MAWQVTERLQTVALSHGWRNGSPRLPVMQSSRGEWYAIKTQGLSRQAEA
jgi:hypothetical protein